MIEALARHAYAAYGYSVGWRNYRGDPMPQWGELPAQIRRAWHEAVRAVLANAICLLDPGAVVGRVGDDLAPNQGSKPQ